MTSLAMSDLTSREMDLWRRCEALGDEVIKLQSDRDKWRHRAEEAIEERNEWRTRCEECQASLSLLESAARAVFTAHGGSVGIAPSKWSSLEYALRETARALTGGKANG
jgi:predicted adenine nucleotide alpha hydrolase (AANH) superfamily ATPase